MFAGSYFAPRYFTHGYFPGANPLKVRYFHHGVFAQRFFPDRYFPGQIANLVKVRYFPHGYFAQRYYADRYFPGNVGVEAPPIPEQPPISIGAGGGAPRIFIPVIHAVADLVIPTPIIEGYGFLTPANVQATLDAQLKAFRVGLAWQALADATPIGVQAQWTFPSVDFAGAISRGKARPTQSDDEEMALLMEHYIRSLHAISVKGRK